MIVLDTNVVSELMRLDPSPAVARFTLAEIRFGIDRLPGGRRKQVLLSAADDIFAAFGDQVPPVDTAAAEHYAAIAADREGAGESVAGFDALIAAVCRSRGAALATRNASDFEATGIKIVDPWREPPGQ
jgi:toxin FitB